MIFLFSFFLISCAAPSEPEFKKLENVKFGSLSVIKPYSVTLNADAIFHNPNVLGANITEMNFDVYINDQKTTKINQDISAKMSPNSDFSLPIKCKIPLKEVFKDFKFKDILKEKVLRYKLDGYLKIGLGNVELKVPVTFEDEESFGL